MNIMTAAAVVASLLLCSQGAQAHCDSVDGPVAKAVEKAFQTGNINLALAFAPATAEAEIRAAFEQSRKVRVLGPDALALADRSFMETVIRLHRAGEGACYAGLKPSGIDYGPAIPAAEHAVETGDLSKLKAVLFEEIEHALGERLAHVRELQTAPVENTNPAELPAARQRISAELGFVTFAESIRQAARGTGTAHSE